jgi:hypothetical protein
VPPNHQDAALWKAFETSYLKQSAISASHIVKQQGLPEKFINKVVQTAQMRYRSGSGGTPAGGLSSSGPPRGGLPFALRNSPQPYNALTGIPPPLGPPPQMPDYYIPSRNPLVALAATVQLVLLLAPPPEVLAHTTVLLGILLAALPMLDLLGLARILVLRLLGLPPLAILEAGLVKSIRAASMLQSLSRISQEAVRLVAPQAMTASSLRNDMLYSKLAKLP